jgi:diguanylate cyclase (GGDEF)-like protein
MFVRCAACGDLNQLPSCSACGAELLIGAAGELHEAAALETASGRDQTLAGRDQTAGDQDQTWSDHDQAASDRDQRSADEDQDAADSDLASGGDPAAHRESALAREHATRDREAVSALRDETAVQRLQTADDRDHAAGLRDRGAESRDALARLHDEQDDTGATREEILLRAERDRARAAADRVKAADDRTRAAIEREQAAEERADALRIRGEADEVVKHATTDELTGARTRRFGLEEMSHELERAHRTGATLILAFVDVDGLKQVNDIEGHLAGDALLQLTGETLRASVRSYDLVVRYGGDEFVCAMPNLSETVARPRFEQIAAALAAVDVDHSITFGLANAEPSDSLQELIARADNDLLATRAANRPG